MEATAPIRTGTRRQHFRSLVDAELKRRSRSQKMGVQREPETSGLPRCCWRPALRGARLYLPGSGSIDIPRLA
jgi:hypothetical protein